MTTAELTADWTLGALKMHGSALRQALVAAGLSEPQAAVSGFIHRKTAVMLVTTSAVIVATEKRFAAGSIEVRTIPRGELGSVTTSPKRRFSRMSLTLDVAGGAITLEQVDSGSIARVVELLTA